MFCHNIQVIKYIRTFAIIILFFSANFCLGQGANCGASEPFCSGSVVTFPAGVNNGDATTDEPGNNYGCLSSAPNPAWYYMEIDNGGNMTIDMTNNGTCTTSGCDIDFALWGPYSDIATATGDCGSLGAPYDCSFDPSATETVTITGASSGDVFLLLITNYSNSASDISFTNASGSATTDCSVLPIELIYFNGKCLDNSYQLKWATSTEVNNNYFTIEKSVDGINFHTIGQVNGAGNSSIYQDYSFIDTDIGSGKSYYRLKQTDFDGTFKYYHTIASDCYDFVFDISPNPFNDNVTVSLPKTGVYFVSIRDYLGRIVYQKRIGNSLSQKINLSSLRSQGIYFISLSNEQNEVVFNKKILKQ